MKKEKILQKSRTENIFGDEREENLKLNSLAISGAIGCFICIIFAIIEETVFNRSASLLWLISMVMLFSRALIIAIKLKEKKDIMASIILGLCCVVLLIIYITDNIA